jgi:formate dehydrogenase major subunit
VAKVAIDAVFQEVRPDEHLIDLINRRAVPFPTSATTLNSDQFQTCDTCMVEVDGRLVRACATEVSKE